MFKRVPGTKDILPEEASAWQKIEEASRSIFSLYNYKEIRPPLIEEASLFDRSLGQTSEIIQKQMFLIKNKEDIYALRPEGTASIARAYIENNLDKISKFAKLFYIGPMFRLERPQKGRLRQFHHIGCEAIGSSCAGLDIEVISLADNLLKGLSIDDYKIKINSLGCAKDKKGLSVILHKGLKDKLRGLCGDCKIRFENNILRVLDCKNDACQEVVRGLDITDTCLCPECGAHFSEVRQGLDDLGINYETAPYLVRGLDYYTRTVFEITHKDLGSQDALGAGGRYDNLIKELGGPDLGAVGFAFGVERLLLAAGRKAQAAGKDLVYLIALGGESKRHGLKLLDDLRKHGITCDTDYENKSLKGALRAANDLGAKLVLIIGENELKKNVVILKDMSTGEQKEINKEQAVNTVLETGVLKSRQLPHPN
ncbi:MAG: histidine--tRNA ligase [Candidatus Omnitrophota bacterium]